MCCEWVGCWNTDEGIGCVEKKKDLKTKGRLTQS